MGKYENLEELLKLKEKGVLTEEEFTKEKNKILNDNNDSNDSNDSNDNKVMNNKQIDESVEKKIKIINVIYGVIMFFSIVFTYHAFYNYIFSGETYYGRQMVSEYKIGLIVGIIIICATTALWKYIISKLRKNNK